MRGRGTFRVAVRLSVTFVRPPGGNYPVHIVLPPYWSQAHLTLENFGNSSSP